MSIAFLASHCEAISSSSAGKYIFLQQSHKLIHMFTVCLKYGGRTIKEWTGSTEAKEEKVARKRSMTEDIPQNSHKNQTVTI